MGPDYFGRRKLTQTSEASSCAGCGKAGHHPNWQKSGALLLYTVLKPTAPPHTLPLTLGRRSSLASPFLDASFSCSLVPFPNRHYSRHNDEHLEISNYLELFVLPVSSNILQTQQSLSKIPQRASLSLRKE